MSRRVSYALLRPAKPGDRTEVNRVIVILDDLDEALLLAREMRARGHSVELREAVGLGNRLRLGGILGAG